MRAAGVTPRGGRRARVADPGAAGTKVTRGAGSPAAALAMVFKLAESAQATGALSPDPTSSPPSATAPASNAASWSSVSRRLQHECARNARCCSWKWTLPTAGSAARDVRLGLTTENTALKQRVPQLTADNRTLDELLKAARSNLRSRTGAWPTSKPRLRSPDPAHDNVPLVTALPPLTAVPSAANPGVSPLGR